jgi:hypothetical protein
MEAVGGPPSKGGGGAAASALDIGGGGASWGGGPPHAVNASRLHAAAVIKIVREMLVNIASPCSRNPGRFDYG